DRALPRRAAAARRAWRRRCAETRSTATNKPKIGTAGTSAWRGRIRRDHAGRARAGFREAGRRRAGASGDARPLLLEAQFDALEARFEAVAGLAQFIDAAQEFLEFRFADEIAALFLQIF